ncbi:hypothetical protein EAF04_009579 [Stromatinia cepivora]|nr:hypothetical protein EAF04_009579 [Stromatinia cepivora]
MAQSKNTLPPKKTGQPRSSSKGRIPAALRNHLPSDGLYKIVSCDLGTGYTSIHIADIEVKSGEFTNLESIKPTHFYRYSNNPNQRPELTTEVPTICAHIPGETDESKAQHGYEVDPVGDETGAVVIDRIKEALYSGPEAREQNKALRNFALRIPYLMTRYSDTQLAAHPEIWMLADYILWLAQLVTSTIIKEDLQGDLIWVCTIPSNWDKNSIKLYTLALDASPILVGRYMLQSEIESAIAGLIHQSPKQSRMEDGDVFFAFDIGKGTSDFSVSRQISSDPTQVEEIMPPAALFAGSRTVLRLWESHIHHLCKKESEDPDHFESDLAISKASFVRSMHAYKGQSGKEVDRVYRICGQKITVTRDQMKSWFDEWMRLTTSFLTEQYEKYYARPDCPPPSKFFLIGGSSNAVVMQTCIKYFLESHFFRNTELVFLGEFNSATLVAYGAIIRAVTSVMSTRKSHYWIGLARKESYDKKKHANVPRADIVNDDIIDENGKMRKEKQVRTVQWWAQAGENCTVDGPIDQMPFIKMAEFFDEEGSVANQFTDYKVPIMVFICPSVDTPQVMDNDKDDIANNGAGKRGWSYQSTRSKVEETDFEIDFSPSIPNPLLNASVLVPVNGFYNVNWTIFAETTGIGIDFWCAVRSNDQDLNDSQMNMRMVYRVLFTDLVGVIQQSYAVDDETVEQNSEDNEFIPKGTDEKEADSDKREVEQLNSKNEPLFPGLVASRPTSTVVAINNTKTAAISKSNKRQGSEQLEEQPRKKKAKNSTLSSQDTNASDEPLIQPQVESRRVKDTLAPASLGSEEVQSPSSKSSEKQLEKSQSEPDEDVEEEGIFINPETLLKNISGSNETTAQPVLEDFEDEDEYNAAMIEYIDQLQREELTRLQAGCDSEACMHFNEQIWIQVCQFIHHKPTLKKPEYCVKVPGGFGYQLLPCQLHGVWHSLRQIHGIAGSIFLCHIMGIGKTTIALAIHWIQHIFNRMWADIHANSKAHAVHGECPVNKQMYRTYGFDCPCSADSSNHWLKERLGVTVALTPLGLLNVWKAEHIQCFKSIPDQILVKAHGTANAGGGDQLDSNTRALLKGTEVFQEEVSQDDEDESLDESEKPKNPSIYTPRIQNGHVFVITTPESFASQFLNKFQHTKTWWYQPPGKPSVNKQGKRYITKPQRQKRETPAYQSCIVSLLFKDEFQLRRTESIRAIQDIQMRQYIKNETKLPHDCRHEVYHRIALVLLSGTPLMTGPLDISGFVQLMCRDSWRKDPVLQNWMHNELQDLGERWKKWTDSRSINTQDISYEITQRFSPLVEKLMIRWTTNGDLLGEKPVIVPRNLYSDIKCDNGPYWTPRVDSLGREESKRLEKREKIRRAKYGHLNGYKPLDKTNVNIYYRSRLCASFPYLLELTDDDGISLKLTEGEWVEKTTGKNPEWKQETDTDPYFKHLEEIVASSGKLREIEKKINKYKDFIDAENKLARQIFCSYFFAGAYIMYLWMIYILKIEPEDVIFLYKPLGQTKINAALARFHIDVDCKIPAEEQKTARYIVSTSSSFAVGLTLAEAISVGFLEPDYHADTIAQGIHRHCRQGNKNLDHGVESWMFMVKDNKVEGRIFDVNNLRKQIINAAERKVDGNAGKDKQNITSNPSISSIDGTNPTSLAATHL